MNTRTMIESRVDVRFRDDTVQTIVQKVLAKRLLMRLVLNSIVLSFIFKEKGA